MELQVFLNKFKELFSSSPRIYSSSRDNENCPYTDELAYSKNCYQCCAGGWGEDSYYCYFIVKCKDCVDSTKIVNCELCYECTDCDTCYNSSHLLQCKKTRDSEYCYAMRNSNNCFLSSAKRNKSFLFKNKQYTETEYRKLVEQYKLEHTVEEIYKDFLKLIEVTPHIATNNLKVENCFGDELTNCNNVYRGFDLVNAEDFMYSMEGGYGKDCCDTFLTTGELNYECIYVNKDSYNCNFSVHCVTCADCDLCVSCWNSSNLFACSYLNRKRFYILNEPYSEDEYYEEVSSLKRQLSDAEKLSLDMFTEIYF